MIQLQNIKYSYPEGTIGLDDISLEIEKGSKVAFLGENGAGKSSLFLVLNGIHKPQKGKYVLDGKQFGFSTTERKQMAHKVGYVFQDPDVQLFAASVYEDVAFGPFNLGLDKKDIEIRVEKYLNLLSIQDLKDKAPHQLSYGQKKQVAVAGVLAMEPEIILFDEPFAWLDNRHKHIMNEIIDDLNKQGKTVLISTHNPDFAYEWADNVVLMKEGRIIASDSPVKTMCNKVLMQEIGMELPLVVQLAKKLGLKNDSRSIQSLLWEM
ncbi:energy-coupling factor ABC transporter ATP-binding protein [Labilibaculum antarcticum]|uniref:ABC transporter ATP-binding protein n=1 Tax=Labilibaculum antarcticum TaxID=1717717 RepID=A0A1Y1CN09_9BACT|nr:ATP-binding cassette domain-containing protein [Labilibaculum antarcticum]BAX81806.1 energy-coupling factor ABC transporter ATP-binding protein [Labilibaculum antarcticum]